MSFLLMETTTIIKGAVGPASDVISVWSSELKRPSSRKEENPLLLGKVNA